MNKQIYWKMLLFLSLSGAALILSAMFYYLTRESGPQTLPASRQVNEQPSIESRPRLEPKDVIVTRVIDGDTIVVEGGVTVRLLGIDADERGYPCYFAAKERLKQLVLGKSVGLAASESDIDRYGRSLRYVFLESVNISVLLAREGLVVKRFFPDNQLFREELTLAESEAKAAKRGCEWEQDSRNQKP